MIEEIDSFKKRFAYKIIVNCLSLLVGFITAGIVPKTLGVEIFGNYSYLTGLFIQVIAFAELRSSTFLFSRVSQRPQDKNIIIFYLIYSIIIFIVILIIIITTYFLGYGNIFYPNIRNILYIISCFIFVYLGWFKDLISLVMDALGLTVWNERIRLVIKLVSIVILIGAVQFKILTVASYLLIQCIILISQILIVSKVVTKSKKYINTNAITKIKIIKKDFINYCTPLFFYVFLGAIYQIADRWMLQHYSGSYQQGLYSFSQSISIVALLFSNSVFPIFFRDMAIFASNKDKLKMAKLFNDKVPLFYFIVSYFCSFLFVESRSVISLFGGAEYSDALGMFRILILYPLIMSYSNFHSTILYSLGKTKIYVYLSLITTPISLISSYLILNNTNSFIALSMGGFGLALKEFIIGLLNCYIYIIVNSKLLKISLKKDYILIVMIPSLLIIISTITKLILGKIFYQLSDISGFFLSGFIYTIIVLLILLFRPNLFGINKSMIFNFRNIVFNKLLKKVKGFKI